MASFRQVFAGTGHEALNKMLAMEGFEIGAMGFGSMELHRGGVGESYRVLAWMDSIIDRALGW